jgi:hypothetical protein
MTMRAMKLALIAAILGAGLHAEARASPLSDCYDLAILECGLVWGEQDSGDDGYKKCINDQFDKCDRRHQSDAHPGGKFKLKVQQTRPHYRLRVR